jgi:membrane protease YdiL (CAAX protease family)
MMVAEVTAAGPEAPLWLILVVVACVPATIVAMLRIGRWWISGAPLPLPLDKAWPAIRWSPEFGLGLFVLLALATQLIIPHAYMAGKEQGLWPWEPLRLPEMFGMAIFLGQAVPPLLGLAALWILGRGAAETAGVRIAPLGAGLLAGVVAAAVVLPVCMVALKINVILVVLAGGQPQLHPVLETIGEQPTWGVTALALFQAGIMAPLAEEFIYRGVLMMTLMKAVGIGRAILVSSAIFAVMHLPAQPQAVLPLFVLALGLGYIAYRTRSLVGPVVAHSVFNSLMVLSAFTA